MSSPNKLNSLLCSVGLLRGRLSFVMQTIQSRRQDNASHFRENPRELDDLLAKAQGTFSNLLKASYTLQTAAENIRSGEQDAFDIYLEDWAMSQTGEILNSVAGFFRELAVFSCNGLSFAPDLSEDGSQIIRQAMENGELT